MAMSPAIVRGSAQLMFDGISGLTHSVESMHRAIALTSTSWLDVISGTLPVQAIRQPRAYSVIQKTCGHLNKGVAGLLGWLQEHADLAEISDQELRWVSALNGVCGDHLETTGNALAQPLRFMTRNDCGKSMPYVALPDPTTVSPNIVILVHGLCHSDQSWSRQGNMDLGQRLQDDLGLSPVYLRYNSGRHISTNGRELASMLDELTAAWPVPVESLCLVGYSMGGLVLRSACWYAELEQQQWLTKLRRVLFLGTPHHGSPLEKAGHAFDTAMQSVKYVAPLMFGRKRSAGIKDLRNGNLLDEDWQNAKEEKPGEDNRRLVPLLPGVDYFFAAASVGSNTNDLKGHILGDMLVRLGSATGSHADGLRSLNVKSEHCRIFLEKNHFDLLSDERVHRQVIAWFTT